MDRDFIRRSIYCIDGDGEVTTCATTFGFFHYPATLADTAEDCGLNYVLWPDGKGFAINFDKVLSIHKISKATNPDGSETIGIQNLSTEVLSKRGTYYDLTLSDIPPIDGGSCVVFSKHYMLFLPASPREIHALQQTSTDLRNFRRRPPGPGLDLRF